MAVAFGALGPSQVWPRVGTQRGMGHGAAQCEQSRRLLEFDENCYLISAKLASSIFGGPLDRGVYVPDVERKEIALRRKTEKEASHDEGIGRQFLAGRVRCYRN